MIEIYDENNKEEPQTLIYVEGIQFESLLMNLINEKELILAPPGKDHSLRNIIADKFKSDIEYILLYDRNICSYLNDLVIGNFSNNPIYKNIIAVMAYTQIASIISEPTIAYYEYAQNSDFNKLKNDLSNFSKADNHDFRNYLKYLNGQLTISELSKLISQTKENDYSDFTEDKANRRITLYKHNILTINKASILALEGKDSFEIINDLLQWMYTEYLFTGVALPWLIQNFNPLSLSRIKKEISFRQISNWTWDITLIQYFIEKNKEFEISKKIYLLSSNDLRLKKAFKASVINGNNTFDNAIYNLVYENWRNISSAHEIEKKYNELSRTLGNPKRMVKKEWGFWNSCGIVV